MIGFLTANPTPKKPKRSVAQNKRKNTNNKRVKNDEEGATDDEGIPILFICASIPT